MNAHLITFVEAKCAKIQLVGTSVFVLKDTSKKIEDVMVRKIPTWPLTVQDSTRAVIRTPHSR